MFSFSKYEEFFDVFPKLKNLANTKQDLFFHGEGDVWTHTKMVCDELVKLKDFTLANDEDKFIMFYSCLLHDIAKDYCTIEENGKIISPGHSKKGSIDVRVALWEIDIPFLLREEICNIIENHQVPFFAINPKTIFFNGEEIQMQTEYTALKLASQLKVKNLINVAKADILGRICQDKNKVMLNIEVFEELTKELNVFESEKVFPSEATKLKYFRSLGAISPDYEFHQDFGSHVLLLSGLPASGKDTYCKNFDMPIISFDDAKEMIKNDKSIENSPYNITISHAKKLLAKKENFIWNSTNLSSSMREKTINLLYKYGAYIEVIYLEEKKNVILNRNQKRNSTLKNSKIQEMLLNWEVPKSYETHHMKTLINNSSEHKINYKI